MAHALIRWTLLCLAFFVLGPLVGGMASGLRSPDGAGQVSMLLSDSGAWAWCAVVLCFAVAGGMGAITARFTDGPTGIFVSGLVLVWAAGRAGSIEGIVRWTHSASTFRTLALEGAIVGVLTAALGALVMRTARAPVVEAPSPAFGARTAGLSRSVGALVGAVVVAGLAATVVARSALPGQAIAAAVAAGALGALAGMMIHHPVRAHWMLGAMCVLLVVGPASAGLSQGDVVHAVYAGQLTPLARLTPLHWAAGLLLGLPVGCSWGGSLVKKAS